MMLTCGNALMGHLCGTDYQVTVLGVCSRAPALHSVIDTALWEVGLSCSLPAAVRPGGPDHEMRSSEVRQFGSVGGVDRFSRVRGAAFSAVRTGAWIRTAAATTDGRSAGDGPPLPRRVH